MSSAAAAAAAAILLMRHHHVDCTPPDTGDAIVLGIVAVGSAGLLALMLVDLVKEYLYARRHRLLEKQQRGDIAARDADYLEIRQAWEERNKPK